MGLSIETGQGPFCFHKCFRVSVCLLHLERIGFGLSYRGAAPFTSLSFFVFSRHGFWILASLPRYHALPQLPLPPWICQTVTKRGMVLFPSCALRFFLKSCMFFFMFWLFWLSTFCMRCEKERKGIIPSESWRRRRGWRRLQWPRARRIRDVGLLENLVPCICLLWFCDELLKTFV